MKATECRFEIVEVQPNDPNHWTNFDLEQWVAELLWCAYLKRQENQKPQFPKGDDVSEKSQST